MLTDREAKSAYDRLAANKFQEHDCTLHGEPAVLADSESFAARARKLVLEDSSRRTQPKSLCRKSPSRTATIPVPPKKPRPTPKISFAA